jgi:DNA invertase Pin-like site-specific DNA recombinase
MKRVRAFSYIRFSYTRQAAGDSLRRQREKTAEYCERKGWELDGTLTPRDLGVSAFRGRNALVGNLGLFLQAVQAGKVPPGSALIVESLDRISRQGVDEGLDIIKKILKAGVTLVTLSPERHYDREAVRSLTNGLLEILVILERAAEESETKSERIAAVWKEKRKAAQKNKTLVSRRLPGWVRERDGKLEEIPEHAATVKRIFHLAAAGYGQLAITKKLIADGVPTFLGVVRHRDPDNPECFLEKPGEWNRVYIKILLKDRRVRGELQLRNGDGSKAGEPIPGYFPETITKDEWNAAQGERKAEGQKPRRHGKHLDLFTGLVRDALTGDTMMATTRTDKGRHARLLVNLGSGQGQAPCRSFPLPTFEWAILDRLREIDPHDILNGDGPPDESAALSGEVEQLKLRRAALKAAMVNGNLANLSTVTEAAAVVEEELREKQAELDAARLRKYHPVSEAWGEAKPLLAAALAEAPDPQDARLRLRGVLKRMIDGIWLVIVPRGRDRLAAAQIWFKERNRHREYVILHRPPKSNGKSTSEGWRWVESFPDLFKPGHADLRNPKHVARVERFLRETFRPPQLAPERPEEHRP